MYVCDWVCVSKMSLCVFQFKQLMNKLDPFDGDDNGSDQDVPSGTGATSSGNTSLHNPKVRSVQKCCSVLQLGLLEHG